MAYQNPDPPIDDEIITTTENDADYTQINNVYFAFIDVLGFKKSFDAGAGGRKTESTIHKLCVKVWTTSRIKKILRIG